MKAYTGKVLWVDLTHGSWFVESIPDEIYQKYLGGTGLGAWLLYRTIPARAGPLGPDNVLGFLPGLLTGTGSLFTGRWMAVARLKDAPSCIGCSFCEIACPVEAIAMQATQPR